MNTEKRPPALHRGAATNDQETAQVAQGDSTGQVGQNPAPWPECLPDRELKKLVSQLDAAVAASCDLPGSMAEYDDLLYAAAIARTALRRRTARGRIAAARDALRASGWTS